MASGLSRSVGGGVLPTDRGSGVRVRPQISLAQPSTGRVVPVELKDGVALWGRKHGRPARLYWYGPPMNCWAVRLGYGPGDPRAQDGTSDEPVFLHIWRDAEWWSKHYPERAKKNALGRILPGYYAFDLDQLGLSGVINILDKGDLLSGRGEFKSVEQAGQKAEDNFRTLKHRRRLAARDDAKARARDLRRHLFKIPFLPVGVSIGGRANQKKESA